MGTCQRRKTRRSGAAMPSLSHDFAIEAAGKRPVVSIEVGATRGDVEHAEEIFRCTARISEGFAICPSELSTLSPYNSAHRSASGTSSDLLREETLALHH